MATQVPAVRGAAFVLPFSLYKSDGTIIANPGAYTARVSKDGGALAAASNAVVEVDTTYGLLTLTLTAAEMTADVVYVQVKDDTAGCVPFTAAIHTSAQSLDAVQTNVSSRLAAASYAAPDNAGVAAIKAKTDNLPAAPAAVGDIPTAVAIANEVEAQIINEADSEKVLTAITDKIASVNPSLSGLTLAAIATAVRTELATELARIDATISSRLAAAGYTAPDNAGVTNILTRLALMATETGNFADFVSAQHSLEALASSGSNLTAADVWQYVDRTLTAATGGGATAQEVWEYATRSLTDKAGFTLTAAYDPAKTAATAASLATVAGYIDTEVATLLANVGTLLERITAGRAAKLDRDLAEKSDVAAAEVDLTPILTAVDGLPTLAEMEASPKLAKYFTGWVRVGSDTLGKCTDQLGNELSGVKIDAFLASDVLKANVVNHSESLGNGDWEIWLPPGADYVLVFSLDGQETTTTNVTV